ncbi:S-adenosyl-L-methionine-dependent methyltransferase [Choiromyces venosus 120613-1]|uniref:S-adenosyl-L-methionine-dependent methyltransferase n=1 Tax=Choiromyces venosus 120613-1 TaxID=1336337 RepID=A0A3N4K403_9PEZI|nr:S-adenosyl-L-methionine-dependent methyltransferase [Choiromyces venosus 120613-1]
MNTFTTAFNHARKVSGSITWEPLVGLSIKIEHGRLVITFMDGRQEVFGGEGDEKPEVELMVRKEMFWVWLFLFADMGFSEAYMLRKVDCTLIKNRTQLSNAGTISSAPANSLTSFLRSINNLQNSLLNVAAHYDISNDMFAASLSPDMTYSCAIFPHLQYDAPATTTEELEAAHFAMEAVARTRCRATSLTLSVEQKALAEKRIAAAGMADKISVLLGDYRALAMPQQKKKFDKIVSIEMLEAVGGEYLETCFEVVGNMLKKDGGIAVFQCITMPENIKGNLLLESVENIDGYYTRTPCVWRENFLRTFKDRVAPALKKEHPEMNDGDVEVFSRKWEVGAGFKAKILNDIIFTVAREGATELYEGVPL